MSNLIPPINAQPDPNAPELASFCERPAESLHRGDYLVLHGVRYRIEGRQRYQSNRALHHFTLYPVAGGRIVTCDFYARERLPSFCQECP